MQRNAVRETRQRQGKTMTAVALDAGINMGSLSLIERGANCTQRTASKLATALNVSARKLFPRFADMREGTR